MVRVTMTIPISPMVKTRSQKLAMLACNATSKITVFDADKINDDKITVTDSKPTYMDILSPTKHTTPIKCSSTKSQPSTPHRIELRNDSNEENNCKKTIVKPALAVPQPPAPKARRKLNNNTNTHNSDVKSVEKDNHKLTEYFPVRRSVRKTKTTVLEEKQFALERNVRNNTEDGLEVRIFGSKGRGVVAAKDFQKGDFVVEYSGDLIDVGEAKAREAEYARNETTGCYMYYFRHGGQQYCIDATAESGKLGRLINHSRNGNLYTKSVMVDGRPRLVLLAKDEIKAGQELLYDYGDRSKESLKYHPWLAY